MVHRETLYGNLQELFIKQTNWRETSKNISHAPEQNIKITKMFYVKKLEFWPKLSESQIIAWFTQELAYLSQQGLEIGHQI